jgi:2-dehydropantoate 2-reductase
MRIAILGAGAIGSTFALQLAGAGHEISLVARGARLARITADRAIVTRRGHRAPVEPRPTLAPDDVHDLVLVTVLAHQVEAVLPALQANASPSIMFMFNTFGGLAALRDAVGRERFSWGFPAIVAKLVDGALDARILPRALSMLQTTTVGALADHAPPGLGRWAEVFTRAGIPSVVEPDMESWLRTHAAFMAPLMAAGVKTTARGRGLSWRESGDVAAGMRAGLALVRRLGHRLTPSNMALLGRMPPSLIGAGLWLSSRLPVFAALGAGGATEPLWLLDAMQKAAPEPPEPLLRLAEELRQLGAGAAPPAR